MIIKFQDTYFVIYKKNDIISNRIMIVIFVIIISFKFLFEINQR